MRHRSKGARGASPLLYLISDRNLLAPGELLTQQLEALHHFVARAIAAGVDLVQIREKDLDARTLCNFTRAVVGIARESRTEILVNERFDVALAAGADGVHLTSASMPAEKVREVVGEKLLIGASTHSAAELSIVERFVDFAVLGPVFETASKAKYGPPLGLDRFEEIVRARSVPIIALGGIDESKIEAVTQAGASGVAGISMFAHAPDLSALVARVRASESPRAER